MSDMNATLRTSLQAKLGRWATSMRKYIAARLIERRVVDRGMHQEKTTVTFYLGKTCPKCITWNILQELRKIGKGGYIAPDDCLYLVASDVHLSFKFHGSFSISSFTPLFESK